MSKPYEADILEWSEQQAALPRRDAAGESLLVQAMPRLLKPEAWPLSLVVPGWQAEARLFRAQARRPLARSMRHPLDLPGLYADAVRAMPDTIDGAPRLPVPAVCSVTLDELLAEA